MRSSILLLMTALCRVCLSSGNSTDELLVQDPFDPPNCADRVYETEVVGDGSPTTWTYWQKVSVSISSKLQHHFQSHIS